MKARIDSIVDEESEVLEEEEDSLKDVDEFDYYDSDEHSS